MTRREFISLLGGAAAWPLAARIAQLETKDRIGVLLDLFGRKTTVSLREAEVTAA